MPSKSWPRLQLDSKVKLRPTTRPALFYKLPPRRHAPFHHKKQALRRVLRGCQQNMPPVAQRPAFIHFLQPLRIEPLRLRRRDHAADRLLQFHSHLLPFVLKCLQHLIWHCFRHRNAAGRHRRRQFPRTRQIGQPERRARPCRRENNRGANQNKQRDHNYPENAQRRAMRGVLWHVFRRSLWRKPAKL